MAIVLKKSGTVMAHTPSGGIVVGTNLGAPTKKQTDYGKHLGVTDVKAKEVSGQISIQKKGQGEPAVTNLPVNKGAIDGGCKVGVGGSRTINLGNYESIKISVWLEMPCEKSTISETYDYVSDWVGEQLTSAVKMTKEN
jgi:hypothetical protein